MFSNASDEGWFTEETVVDGDVQCPSGGGVEKPIQAVKRHCW